jgi:hypothetical protein
MAAKKQERPKEEQARHRSPNYPAVGLRDAVERVRAIVEKDGKAGAKLDLAAKHIGFSGPHGTARAVLSALRKFGLTADQNGRIVPTQQAMDILHFPPNHERSIAARRSAATGPLIYQKLLEQFSQSGNLPSAESLRAELVADWGFNPKAVDAFLTDFLDTLNYAGLIDGNKLLLSGESQQHLSPESVVKEAFSGWPGANVVPLATTLPTPIAPQGPQGLAPPMHRLPSGASGKATRDLTLPLMDNEVAMLRVPSPLSEENFEYLMQQLGLLKRGLVTRLPGAASAPEPTTPSEMTLELRRRLLALGYTPADISQMSAADAWEIIAEREVKAE